MAQSLQAKPFNAGFITEHKEAGIIETVLSEFFAFETVHI